MADDSSEVVKEMAESVAAANLKTLGDGPAFFQNQMFALAVSQAAGMISINQAIVGKVAESIIAVSPAEGGSDVAALGQLMKGLALTPPANREET
jgi:hypothetical protein